MKSHGNRSDGRLTSAADWIICRQVPGYSSNLIYLKGTTDIASRKKCHNTDPKKDLYFMIARLADQMPPMLTLLDGIYTNERGPNIDGRMRRSNLLVSS